MISPLAGNAAPLVGAVGSAIACPARGHPTGGDRMRGILPSGTDSLPHPAAGTGSHPLSGSGGRIRAFRTTRDRSVARVGSRWIDRRERWAVSIFMDRCSSATAR